MAEINKLNIEKLEIAAGMLKSLAHPMRIAILNLLEGGKEMTVTEIHELLGMEQAAASHHLGILKGKGTLFTQGWKEYLVLPEEQPYQSSHRVCGTLFLQPEVMIIVQNRFHPFYLAKDILPCAFFLFYL